MLFKNIIIDYLTIKANIKLIIKIILTIIVDASQESFKVKNDAIPKTSTPNTVKIILVTKVHFCF